MRSLVLAVVLLSLAACDAPLGASDQAPPPADAPIIVGPDYAGDFDALGTEPFWSVRVRGEAMTLSRPDQPDVVVANTGARADGDQGVWDAMSGERRLVLRLTPVDCADGMSDRRYGYAAEVWIDGETLRGCADRPAMIASSPRP